MSYLDFTNYSLHFLTFFLTGLAVNLTPCVYPMLTVTVSLFKPAAGEKRKLSRSFGRALVYVLGMSVMYSGLGVFAALTGTLFGGILQHKVVIVAVALLMLWLALSMFGVITLSFSSQLLSVLERLRRLRFFGLFFSGMFVGIFAAPCIGPPVVALLASVANKGNLFFGFLSFFVFSLGLGLPYLIFATFSGLLKKIPRAGSWLVWVEHTFGVILLGFSGYYFALAFDGGWIRWILPVTALAGGFYLGFIDRAGQDRVGFVRFKWSAGLIGMMTGLAILASFFRQEPGRLVWEPYKLHKLYIAQQEKKPVVIDFYADWCFTCHELEENVFRNPTVMETLSRFVRLRLDATDMESRSVQEALERYNIIGLPIVVFMDAQGKEVEDARVIGLVSAAEFIQSMDLTLKKSESVNN